MEIGYGSIILINWITSDMSNSQTFQHVCACCYNFYFFIFYVNIFINLKCT